MKQIIASTMILLTMGGASKIDFNDRYEYVCDRVEQTAIGVDYAVIEVYDRQDDTITMINVALPYSK